MKIILIVLLTFVFVLCGCSAAPSEQGELQLDVRVTEAPKQPVVETEATAEQSSSNEASTVETDATDISAGAETKPSYAEALCAAFAQTGAIDAFAPYSEIDILDYYGIDVAECISAVAYVDTEGYACELVIVEAEEAMAKDIESLLTEYLDMRYKQFESYDADAAQLVKDAVMRRDNGIVLMIVSPQADELLSIYRSFEF